MNRKLHTFLISFLALSTLLLLRGPGTVRAAPGPSPSGTAGRAPTLAPITSDFTYQGSLLQNGSPANGPYDFIFTLYDAPSGGISYWPLLRPNVTVSQGQFSVLLTSFFEGTAWWLEIQVRPVGGGAYTTLTPRQPLTAAPYASSLIPNAYIRGAITGQILDIENSAAQGNGLLSITTGRYGRGMVGLATQSGAIGVLGQNTVMDDTGVGVYGIALSRSGAGGVGVAGYGALAGMSGATASGFGVYGTTTSGIGVVGQGIAAAGGYAGYFYGNVRVIGSCCAAGAGTIQIDDPLDPANKTLSHAFVASPEMMNLYNGDVTLDAKGEATVQLPAWFSALNTDFRYQLTAVGGPGPNLYIAQKVENNRFRIAGGTPGGEVSWQLTGIRQDPYANAHPVPVEADKAGDDRGHYLYPAEIGQSESRGIGYTKLQPMQQIGDKQNLPAVPTTVPAGHP
jgi:hypothetical protein